MKKYIYLISFSLIVFCLIALHLDTSAQSCPLSTQQAYKTNNSPSIFYITENCTKRPFLKASIFFTYFDSWSDVKNTTQFVLDSIKNDSLGFMPWGPKYDPKYGALIKIPSDPKVYLLLGAEKYWITSEYIFNKLNYSWNWIEDVDSRLLNKYNVGSEINYIDHHPNYTLIKYPNSAAVYRLEPDPNDVNRQIKVYIQNENEFNKLGFRWDRIVTISNDEVYEEESVINYPQETVTKVGCQYNNPSCGSNYDCVNNACILKKGCNYGNPYCSSGYGCVNNQCIKEEQNGCQYNNPSCGSNYDCVNNACILKKGCNYSNPSCVSNKECVNNVCVLKEGCQYNNPSCIQGYTCVNNACVLQDNTNVLSVGDYIEIIPGHNNLSENRLNLIFRGVNFESTVDFLDIVNKFIDYNGNGTIFHETWFYEPQIAYGLWGLEPYKSNKNNINLWYYKDIEHVDFVSNEQSSCPYLATLEHNFDNGYEIQMENYLCSPAGRASSNYLRFVTKGSRNEYSPALIRLLPHEFGHAFANLKDTYPTSHGFPNAAITMQEANSWWSDLIGYGCGADGVVDCLEDNENYRLEVGYYSTDADICFDGLNPIFGCSFILQRSWAVDVFPKLEFSGNVVSKNIAFRASQKKTCLSGVDNCMYKENSKIVCVDKKTGISNECKNIFGQEYNNGYWYNESDQVLLRPHISSIMKGNITAYGPVNEREICSAFQNKLGKADGICVTKYGF